MDSKEDVWMDWLADELLTAASEFLGVWPDDVLLREAAGGAGGMEPRGRRVSARIGLSDYAGLQSVARVTGASMELLIWAAMLRAMADGAAAPAARGRAVPWDLRGRKKVVSCWLSDPVWGWLEPMANWSQEGRGGMVWAAVARWLERLRASGWMSGDVFSHPGRVERGVPKSAGGVTDLRCRLERWVKQTDLHEERRQRLPADTESERVVVCVPERIWKIRHPDGMPGGTGWLRGDWRDVCGQVVKRMRTMSASQVRLALAGCHMDLGLWTWEVGMCLDGREAQWVREAAWWSGRSVSKVLAAGLVWHFNLTGELW